ncbi:MAG: hypothetical protein HZB51_18475 [Chloroflexi bacterium]|nr:hypothetical protein [Chloroflexota bacterium]
MVTVSMDRAHLGWRFWSAWMAASIISVIVYMMMIPVFFSFIDMLAPTLEFESISQDQQWILQAINFFGMAVLGALIGLAQWLLLRRYLPRSGWWILATAIGCIVPMQFGEMFPWRDPPWLGGAIMFMLFGLTLGIAQWFVLRRYMAHSVWWTAFTLVGWLLAFALTSIAYVTDLYVEPFDLLSAFIVPIGTSGIGMVWLLRQSPHLSNVRAH